MTAHPVIPAVAKRRAGTATDAGVSGGPGSTRAMRAPAGMTSDIVEAMISKVIAR
jgi:hypothetical protein